MSLSRRIFLASASAAAIPAAADDWSAAADILRRIRPPRFPSRDFDIARYGAAPGKDATLPIRDAIRACSLAGGGRVVVPPGIFPTGAIHLAGDVNLHLASGATLRFSQNPRDYLPAVFTRWEGMECINYSPFIYAFGARNVAITGDGVLDGQSDCAHWWPWKGRTECGWKKGDPDQARARDALIAMVERNVPPDKRIFGDGSLLRPMFIQPYRCTNVLIEGVTIRNSPMWEINPVLCTNVTVRGVKIASHGPNNDGCNPESCTDTLIENCLFDTGDDCIAIKSGRNEDGRRLNVPCDGVIVRGCTMKDGHGGVTIGSEMSGGVRNVFIENCRMDSPNLDRALRFKTNAVRGGVIERVRMRNVTIGQVADAVIHVDFFYEEGAKGPHLPLLRDVDVRDVTCRKSRHALYLRGFPSAPIRGIHLENCTFSNVALPDVLENVEALTRTNVRINGKLV